MDAVSALTLVLIVAAIIACGAVAWASIEASRTFRSTRDTSDSIRKRIVPLLDKLDITVDAANAELMRVDAVITRLEDATARVGAASETIAEIVHAPREAVGTIAEKVRRAWRNRKSAKAGDETESPHAPDVAGSTRDYSIVTPEVVTNHAEVPDEAQPHA